jgi:hypothetical protein
MCCMDTPDMSGFELKQRQGISYSYQSLNSAIHLSPWQAIFITLNLATQLSTLTNHLSTWPHNTQASYPPLNRATHLLTFLLNSQLSHLSFNLATHPSRLRLKKGKGWVAKRGENGGYRWLIERWVAKLEYSACLLL